MSNLYIGLLSGTSMDGVDAAVVEFNSSSHSASSISEKFILDGRCCIPEQASSYSCHSTASTASPGNLLSSSCRIIATLCEPYPDPLYHSLSKLIHSDILDTEEVKRLDRELGLFMGELCQHLIAKAKLNPSDIAAIGSHGQTIRHEPNAPEPYSLQIGSGALINKITGITTVADFRTADIQAGGQGAPLVPAFHHRAFNSSEEDRMVVNIGGIANVTVLPKGSDKIAGFDTGPGNTLCDQWILKNLDQHYDKDGQWAASGRVNQSLLERCLDDLYFKIKGPKSTGREYFHLAWLENKGIAGIAPEDVQATCVALTALSIVNQLPLQSGRLLLCGGGAKNHYLVDQIKQHGNNLIVESTKHYGIHPDWVEACAFAWFAMQRLNNAPANIPAVTGANKSVLLGEVFGER